MSVVEMPARAEEPPPPASRGAVNAAIITPQSPHQQLGRSSTHRIYPANVLLAAISSFKRHFKHSTFDNFGKKRPHTIDNAFLAD